MKHLREQETILGCKSADEVFSYFQRTLADSIKFWTFFVNWTKVNGNVAEYEIDLNMLNYLVGKNDIEAAFRELLARRPSLIRLIPVLLACRYNDFSILTGFADGGPQYERFDFSGARPLSPADIQAACHFADKTGLFALFQSKKLRSVVDYVLGVEVGLDSNGRKNRSGTAMEDLVADLLGKLCKQNGWPMLPQATAVKMKREWGVNVHAEDAARSFDFAVRTPSRVFLIEVNYYSGGGSKLKATAGEYRDLFSVITRQGHGFIWITDGLGWQSALAPIRETFDKTDYILNLQMAGSGLLHAILAGKTG
ncbi:MAG: type II restriction endonuclease [Planctomycetota bacterium]